MIVSRTGYTGELGYEIYFKEMKKMLKRYGMQYLKQVKNFNIQPVGLAARDSLRLEDGILFIWK
jgi:aminomethyltransferase